MMQTTKLSEPLEFTGERFTPECVREICYEHIHRYALAARWCANTRTLDAACGEGYGSALLAQSAASVAGVDISDITINHARQRYGQLDGLEFHIADCINLPFADNEFDRVVSFETLEHLAEQEQLLAEFRRVLKPDGFLILSSPDKASYSDGQGSVNEFHVKELYREELESLIGQYFPVHHLLGQKLMFHSVIWAMAGFDTVSLDQVSGSKLDHPTGVRQAPMYFIALCSGKQASLPDSERRVWLFDDLEETVYQHYYGEIRRNMAAGGVIAGLEKEISQLKNQLEKLGKDKRPWWQRLMKKN